MRTWSYNSASFRSVRILSWDHGVGCLLNSLQALKTLTTLQVDFLAFSQTKLRALQALFRNEACRIDDFRLCCCPSVHQCYKITSIIPILPSGLVSNHDEGKPPPVCLWRKCGQGSRTLLIIINLGGDFLARFRLASGHAHSTIWTAAIYGKNRSALPPGALKLLGNSLAIFDADGVTIRDRSTILGPGCKLAVLLDAI